MGDKSKIQWTDATWNPVRGCSQVSPGCKNCYAERFAERWRGIKDHPFEEGFDLRIVPEKLTEPMRWQRPRRIFVNSMSDLFHEDIPDCYIDEVFGVMFICAMRELPHTFQVLTKRAARMAEYMNAPDRLGKIANAGAQHAEEGDFWQDAIRFHKSGLSHPNIWLGVSVEDQQRADERIPHLSSVPAAVRFLSCEPLLGEVHLERKLAGGIHWVIVGGESGPGARPCAVEWIESIMRQCRRAHVPIFVKQLGSFVVSEERAEQLDDGAWRWLWRAGTVDRKGGDIEEWPHELRVREFPEARP